MSRAGSSSPELCSSPLLEVTARVVLGVVPVGKGAGLRAGSGLACSCVCRTCLTQTLVNKSV